MILIIAEKPKAARRIAEALAEQGVKSASSNKITYFFLERGGKEIVVAAAVGHLYGLEPAKSGWDYPIFETKWVPTYKTGADYSRAYLETIIELSQNADEVVNACDFDLEGSSIFFNILRFACQKSSAKRMKFSTLTSQDLRDAFDSIIPSLDMGMVNAGLARHQLDWLYGINLSRALTHSIKKAGHFSVLSTGRVQGPTLAILAEREREIRNFTPTPYFVLEALLEKAGTEFSAENDTEFSEKKAALQSFLSCIGGDAKVETIERRQYLQNPPTPFDLTTLQTEASRHLNLTPKQTQTIAQSLYEAGLISYPRTSSQKLPKKLGLDSIMKKLSKQRTYSDFAKELLEGDLIPNEGKKDDPAHPSIYPTGEFPKGLKGKDKQLYDLVVRRFLSLFGKPATRETVKATFDIGGLLFNSIGRRTVDKGWMRYYGPYAKFEESELPDFKEGEKIPLIQIDLLAKDTEPPRRYTGSSLLRAMEKINIGTKATRANIIDTLKERGYISGKSFVVSDLGLAVISVLEEKTPKIVSSQLTREFEEKMEEIRGEKRSKAEIEEEAKKILSEVLDVFKKNEKEIGEKLKKGLYISLKIKSEIGPCPKCKEGILKVIKSKRGKRFIGCSNYPECQNSYPLPQKGKLEIPDKICKDCGLPMVLILTKGRRPWQLCIDMDCPSKDAYKKKRAEKTSQ